MFNGNSSGAEEEKKRDSAVSQVFAKKTPSSCIFRSLREDPARGGCILSAGELDSSKEYLQKEGGSWVVAYQVPSLSSVLLAYSFSVAGRIPTALLMRFDS